MNDSWESLVALDRQKLERKEQRKEWTMAILYCLIMAVVVGFMAWFVMSVEAAR